METKEESKKNIQSKKEIKRKSLPLNKKPINKGRNIFLFLMFIENFGKSEIVKEVKMNSHKIPENLITRKSLDDKLPVYYLFSQLGAIVPVDDFRSSVLQYTFFAISGKYKIFIL